MRSFSGLVGGLVTLAREPRYARPMELPWFTSSVESPSIEGLSFRPAQADDILALQRIEREADAQFAAVGHPELADGEVIGVDDALRFVERGAILIATLHTDPVAWAYVGRCGPEACLGQISVAPAHARRGLGTLLLRHVIEVARARAEPTLVLSTQSDVPWNRPWYEREGFEHVAPTEWTEAMQRTTAAQTAAGLNAATRCHLRKHL